MCGIAGVSWNQSNDAVTPADVERMLSVLVHRGPDDGGVFDSREQGSIPNAGPGAVLGHRRLSIIDLGSGHQPMSNEDGTIWITFNGEIYNYRELRGGLVARGHRFATDSDTEVIVHLYEERGIDCVSELRGMFAFAIWDANSSRLFFARDRLGQKPLLYRHVGGRLEFASELKALLQLPNASRELDPLALDQYLLYQYVPHPACILKGYHKLPPAHRAVFENGSLTIERYWSPFNSPSAANDQPSDWKDRLRTTLTEAVRLRMRSDVPLGAFLSGGIDSTIITGLMQELSDEPVHTFSIGFPVKSFDERTYAQQAADHLGTKHHVEVVEPSALEILLRLIWHYDEPFADSSAIPTMCLSEMTRREVTVALSGDGGDELFAGYHRYRAVHYASLVDRLPAALRAVLSARLWQKLPSSVEQKSFGRRVKRFLAELRHAPERRYANWIGIFGEERRSEIRSESFRESLGASDATQFLLDTYQACPGRDFVERTTFADMLSYLPCDILNKVDIASMAYSLECRSPFLDHHVTELAVQLPFSMKYHRGSGKRILINTFRDLLPKDIQTRPKMGFGVPLDHWFRNELRTLLHDTLLSERALARGYFRPEAIRQLIDDHEKKRWDHSARLWSLLVLELWQQMFLDSPTPPGSMPASF